MSIEIGGYVSIIVRTMRGQRSSRLLCQQFFEIIALGK